MKFGEFAAVMKGGNREVIFGGSGGLDSLQSLTDSSELRERGDQCNDAGSLGGQCASRKVRPVGQFTRNLSNAHSRPGCNVLMSAQRFRNRRGGYARSLRDIRQRNASVGSFVNMSCPHRIFVEFPANLSDKVK
jgi:hypothetical protein